MTKRRCSALMVLLTLIALGCSTNSGKPSGQLADSTSPVSADPERPAGDSLPSLGDLLEQYQALGLPLPPKPAKLVRYQAGGGTSYLLNGKVQHQPKWFSLAFELKPGTKANNAIFLRGTDEWQPDSDNHALEVDPESAAAQDVSLFGRDDELVMAIQCHSLGWHKLAQHFLARSQNQAKSSPQKQLVHIAWVHWELQLTQPKIDRGPLAKRMKELIRQDKELDTEIHQYLLKSLELALVPSNAKPGSIEALIDHLVDYHADTGTIGFFVDREDRYWRIAELGFDAVPALIEHLDDNRLTRALMQGFNNFPTWNLQVRHVVSDLLVGLAGQDLGRDWLDRQKGYPVDKAAARAWWEDARNVAEEDYLLNLALPPDAKEVSAHALHVILAKYPKHIPPLYQTVLDKYPELDSSTLAEAVLRSKLANKEKLTIFLNATKHKDNKHRLPALWAIKDLDKDFDSHLLATIENFPKDVPGEYWLCPEAHIARIAMGSDDAGVWQMLKKVTRRSEVGLRMELLQQFGDPRDTRHMPERLRLMGSFLDDTTVRDLSSSTKFEGPSAGSQYDRIEVRDFVALELAHLLRIEVELKPDRSPKEWAIIRRQVQEALESSLAPP